MGMEEERLQTGGKSSSPSIEDPFKPRTRVEKFQGREITLHEPTLAEGLALADAYFEMIMGEDRVMRLKIKEAEYIEAVCRRFFSPPLEINKLPLRAYREVRRLVNIWEDFSGMGALRETMQRQVSSEDNT